MKPRDAIGELEDYIPGKSIPGGIKLSSNENSLGPSPLALRAVEDASATINRYPDGGMTTLRSAIATSWNVSEEMIIIGNGSDEILVMLAGAFMNPGDNAVTSEHTFSQYAFASFVFGGQMRYAPMSNGKLQLTALANLVNDRTRLVFLCNPNNPTGTAFHHDELVKFVESVPEETILVVDEAYADYATDNEFPKTIELIRSSRNVVQLRTFSKIYGLAGLRIGYGIGESEVIRQLWKVRQPFNVGSLAQAAATAALSDTDFVAASLEMNRRGKAQLTTALDKLGVPYYPSQSNYVCAHLGPDAQATIDGLTSRGIAVRPLNTFGLPEYVRITIGTTEEIAALIDALSELIS